MVIKKEFELLKGVPNILSLSPSKLKSVDVENGPRKVFVVLKLMENKIDHFTKKRVFDLITILEKRKLYQVINLDSYNLHCSYNEPTKQLILNIAPFSTDDIYPTNPDPKNIYACMTYSICFTRLVNGTIKIPENYYTNISNFLLSMFVQLFGKEYGLLGPYASEIGKLKFLIISYVLVSFFGKDQKTSYKLAAISSGIDYDDIMEELNKQKNYDFMKISDFIFALSDLKVMPGMTLYSFTSKIFRMLSIHFLPAFEDLSRFMSIITTSSISGSNVVPTFIYRYNKDEYMNLLEISKIIFK